MSGIVNWDATNYRNYYGVRLLVNGAVGDQIGPKNHVGPLTSLGSGYRTLVSSASGDGGGRSVRFQLQAFSDDPNWDAQQARIASSQLKIDYTV